MRDTTQGVGHDTKRKHLPVASTTVIVPAIAPISGVLRRAFTGWEVSGRRRAVVGAATIRSGRRGWGVVAAVRLVVVSSRSRWRWIVLHRAPGRRVVSGSVVVIVATRATFSVSVRRLVAARAVASGRRSTAVVLVKGRRIIRTTAGGTGTPALSAGGHFGLSLYPRISIKYLEFASSASSLRRRCTAQPCL